MPVIIIEVYVLLRCRIIVIVVGFFSVEYWTGGNGMQIEGKWRWLSSSELLTLNTWSPGNPSNSTNDENCMELNGGFWNDDHCRKFERYICELST